MTPAELFFIVLAAVIFGGALVAFSTAAIVRYSRHEDAGNANYPKAFPDLAIILFTSILGLYGLYVAGIFG